MQDKPEEKTMMVFISQDDMDDQFIFRTAISEVDPAIKTVFFYTSQGLIQHLLRIGIEQGLPKPDFIIGDMKEPFFELKDIREIRTFKQFENIPLYIFSEGYKDVDQKTIFELGATQLFHKPNSLQGLKEILGEIISDTKKSLS